MQIVGLIIWILGFMWAIALAINMRQKLKNDQISEHVLETHAFLAAVSIIIIPIMSLSSFHLLWMLPAAFVLSLMSVIFPLNILWIPASLYASLWYIGAKDPGRGYYLAGEYSKAIEYYKELIKKKPDSAEAHFYLALAYDKAGLVDQAIEYYEKTIRLKPTSTVAYNNLGLLYKSIRNTQKAIENFQNALRISPDYDKARLNLGMIYVDLGDIQGAIKEYEYLKKTNVIYADELHRSIEKIRIEKKN